MIVAALLLIVFTARMLWPRTNPRSQSLPKEAVDLTGAILRGSPKAKVVMIEYSEFECPFCGRFARETAPTLWKDYVDVGKVLVAFRHLPLEGRHQHALRAAEAGECANQQGQFWAMHDALFRYQSNLDESGLIGTAQSIGADGPAFETCMRTIEPNKIREDSQSARLLGISVTPSFLLGLMTENGDVRATDRIEGARPLAEFREALSRLLAQANR